MVLHRRLFRNTAALAAVLFLAGFAAGATEPVPRQYEGVTHIHRYESWDRLAQPGCELPGTERSHCVRCGTESRRLVPPRGHDLTAHPGQMPDCCRSGWNDFVSCTRCGYSTRKTIAPFGHSYDREISGVAHRGFSASAPENTLPAYVLAWEQGFDRVECDISFTSDGVPVLLHDPTVDRTSDGTGLISELTYEYLRTLDFGSWKDERYTGVEIPTFEAFLALCRELSLHPYIELKASGNFDRERVALLLAQVRAQGMAAHVTWISSSADYLELVKQADPAARLGLVRSEDATPELIDAVLSLQTGENQVFLDLNYTCLTKEGILRCAEYGIPLEVYTVNSEEALAALPDYVTGVTSDWLNAGSRTGGDWFCIDPPACDEPGVEQRECAHCGDRETRLIPPAHSWIPDVTGREVCSLCSAKKPVSVVPSPEWKPLCAD